MPSGFSARRGCMNEEMGNTSVVVVVVVVVVVFLEGIADDTYA